jgi:hypothetical protein
MMYKQCQFYGKTETGIFCQALFGSSGAFEKTAGAPAFANWETGDALRKYISTITKADRQKYLYTLVNALGAGEYFGSNINSDYFPWNALSHEGQDYGYQTFLGAHAYMHHVNKDPTRAFGVPVLSVLNHPMKRVELIIRLDREKAKVEKADGIITRIEGGEFPDVSMGCKVPFDVCSICGNKSRTKDDYCQHMRPPEELRHIYGPNKLLPDGRRICVINTLPRFFDISFVFIGADKTAKVMAKLAEKGETLCLGDVCSVPRPSADVAALVDPQGNKISGQEKTASAGNCNCEGSCCTEKLASAFGQKSAGVKLSEIIKEVPSGPFAMKRIPEMTAQEPDLKLDHDLIKRLPLPTITGTAGSMGIVLKPREFQTIILIKMGEAVLARELEEENLVFRNTTRVDRSVSPDVEHPDSSLADAWKGYVSDRSSFGEAFAKRKIGLMKTSEIALPTPSTIAHPLLDDIAAAYNGYRQNLLMQIEKAAAAIESDSQLRTTMQGKNLVDMFAKTASLPLVSLDSVMYIAGAYQDRNLLCNNAVAMEVAADPWLKSHFSAQRF